MPNLNYAERWQPELLEIYQQGTLISPFMTTAVKWLSAKTFHFTQMATSGYKKHTRDGGWNKGSFVQEDVPYTLTHDRDISFLVDKLDVDETNETASIQNISNTFTRTQSVPESDALFFSTVATEAQKLTDYHSETKIDTLNEENVLVYLKGILAKGKLRRYRAMGALIMYVRSDIMNLLEQSKSFTHKIEMTQIAEGGIGLETRVTNLDGVTLIEVIDDERFYDKFNFESEEGGFIPAEGAHQINVLVASPLTTKFVPKVASIYYFAPGAHTEGDGYLYQNRACSGVFTFPNGKDKAIDSIYVDVDAE